ATGSPHLHGDCDFAEASVETAPRSLCLSCGSELTRQGISLEAFPTRWQVDGCSSTIPACRHADGTISSTAVAAVWRMVSEDSDQLFPGFPAVHRLSDLQQIGQPMWGRVPTFVDQLNTSGELL